MVDACTWAASEHGCDVDVEVTEMFRGYRLRVERAVGERRRERRSSAAASSRARSRPAAAATPTRWSRAGFDCVLLANGTEANHTPEESVAAERIVRDARRLRGDRSQRGGGAMLKLRRGVVVAADPLTVEVGERAAPGLGRHARWSARCAEGDEVIVNTEALDLGLGSGGFDVVHVNLTRGLDGGGATGRRT